MVKSLLVLYGDLPSPGQQHISRPVLQQHLAAPELPPHLARAMVAVSVVGAEAQALKVS